MTARRLSEASDDEMRALTGTSGVLCDTCGSTGHNTAGHPAAPSQSPTRIMVCGSRGWKDYERVLVRLSTLPKGAIVMHGAAFGADACAHDAATELGLDVEVHAPNAGMPSPQRYHERNDRMLDRASYVLAFWDGKSRGTKSVIVKAVERALPLEVIR